MRGGGGVVAHVTNRMLLALRRAASGGAAGPQIVVLLLAVATVVGTLLWSEVVETSARVRLGAGRAPLLAYLLVRPADCRGHLDLLRVLERSRVSGRIERAGVLLVGDAESSARQRRIVEREYPGARVTVPTRAQRAWLAAHGWDGRPALLVVQRGTGAARLLAPVPMTTPQRLTLIRMLEHLADYAGGPR